MIPGRRVLIGLVALLVACFLPELKKATSAAIAPVPVKEGEPRDPEPKRGDYIYAAAYSRDGKLLALAQPKTHDGKGEDKILLFETRTCKQLHKLTGPTTYCFGVAFSADGSTLFAACNDGIVYSWDVKTGKPGQKLDARAGQCHGITLSPDGKTLVTGHLDTDKKPAQSSIHVWDAATGKHLREIGAGMSVLSNTLTFTPDGKTLAGGCNSHTTDLKDFNGVIEWDLATGKERKRYDAVRITPGAIPITHAIKYTRDGKWILVGGGEWSEPVRNRSSNLHGYVWLFDRATGKLAKTLVTDRTDYVRMLLLSPDGSRLYFPTNAGSRNHMVIGELQCWDTFTWELKWTKESDPGYWALIASSDGKRIATATGAGFYLFDAKTGEPRGGLVDSKRE